VSGPRSTAAQAGIGLGSAIAVAIIWAAIHGFLSWFYVIYYALTRPGGIGG
jgi:hypothetical protein